MNKLLIVGVDGGATKVSAWEVKFNDKTRVFSLGSLNAEKKYSEIHGFIENFKPVDIQTQLKDRDSGNISPSPYEQQQEEVYVKSCALVIEEIAKRSDTKNNCYGALKI